MSRKPNPPNAQDTSGNDIWVVYGAQGPLKSFTTETEAYEFATALVNDGERVYV